MEVDGVSSGAVAGTSTQAGATVLKKQLDSQEAVVDTLLEPVKESAPRSDAHATGQRLDIEV
jgi:hypothetical protein